MTKSPEAFRTISEVATELDVPQHVLRFWETKFAQVKPLKRGGGRRYYRPDDLELLRGIRTLLYSDGMTIKGVQKVFREQGVRAIAERGRGTKLAAIVKAAPVLPVHEPARPPNAANGDALAREALETVLAGLLEAQMLLSERRTAVRPQAPAILLRHA